MLADHFVRIGYSLIEQLEKQHTEQQQHLITVPQDILDTKDRVNRLLQIISGKMTLVDESWIDVRRRKEDIKVSIKLYQYASFPL